MHLVGRLMETVGASQPGPPAANIDLAILLLGRVRRVQDLLPRQEAYIDLLAEHIGNTGPNIRNNPEIFPLMHALLERPRRNDEIDSCLFRIAVHVGLVSTHSISADSLGPKYWRLWHSHRVILHTHAGTFEDVTSTTTIALDRTDSVILLPTRGLFADLLPTELYPHPQQPVDRNTLYSQIQESLSLLESYCPLLRSRVDSTARTIVATARSYSCRLMYFGGIFIDVSVKDPIALAEAILHEYSHLELWRLWEVSPVLAVKHDGTYVESPVTGRLLPKDIMAQAYLIYLECSMFLSWAADTCNSTSARVRANTLAAGAEELGSRLLSLCSPGNDRALRELLSFGQEWTPS